MPYNGNTMKKPTRKSTALAATTLSIADLARVVGGVQCKNPDTGETITVRGLGCPEGWEKTGP